MPRETLDFSILDAPAVDVEALKLPTLQEIYQEPITEAFVRMCRIVEATDRDMGHLPSQVTWFTNTADSANFIKHSAMLQMLEHYKALDGYYDRPLEHRRANDWLIRIPRPRAPHPLARFSILYSEVLHPGEAMNVIATQKLNYEAR